MNMIQISEDVEEKLTTPWLKVTEKLEGWLESFILNLPNIIVALIVFTLSYFISKTLRNWANKYLTKVFKETSIRNLVANVVATIAIILGIVMALSVLNLDDALTALLTGAGVAGLAVSLALQGTLSNTFSGLFIALKDEINVGDWIETNGFSGKVIQIDLRNTLLVEADNNIVVLPNKLIVENPFKNFGLTKRIRTTITCGVGYESDLKQVKKIAVNAIEKLFPPSAHEEIEFFYTDFGESSIDFMLRFWVNGKENITALDVKSMAIIELKEAFDKNDINIPFPIRTLLNDSSKTIVDSSVGESYLEDED